MVIHDDILRVGIGRGKKRVPCGGREETIVQDDRGVGHSTHLTVGVTVELADRGFVETRDERLIEDLDADYDIVILRLCVLLGNGGENLKGLRNGGTAGPCRGREALARIVEAILRSWGAV